jgi:peptide/nickel transport system ATP-binding protein/oligopeptide transport system ATP-binding protein
MNLGGIVETAAADALFAAPRHPYSRALLVGHSRTQAAGQTQPHRAGGRDAERAQSARRLPLPYPLPLRHRALPHRNSAAARRRHGTRHRLSPHAELPAPGNIVPADGGFSPVLEKLVAAFSGGTEGAGPRRGWYIRDTASAV